MLLKKSRSPFFNFPWKSLFKPWHQVDWVLFWLPVIVTVFGGLVIRSTELGRKMPIYDPGQMDLWTWMWQYFQALLDTNWFWHLVMGFVGILITLVLSLIRYENFLHLHWVTYGLTNASLLAVMAFGKSAKGAQRWLPIAGFQIQPSEFAKVGIIITLAALLHKRTASDLNNTFRALAVTAVPWGLVFVQPDLATSLVFGAIVLGMLYWADANPGWLILLVSPVIAAILFSLAWPFPIVLFKEIYLGPLGIVWSISMGVLGWFTLPWRRYALGAIGSFSLNMLGGEMGIFAWNHVLRDYQKNRLISFMNPEGDPLGTGYHLIQSRIAIGAGEIWGWGLNNGPMTQLNFVPEQHTDFIFSAVGEEFGFVGCFILLSVMCLICFRLLYIAQTAKDNFGSLLAIGVLSMIVFHTIVNVGMNVGLAPVAGIPLPWMSYGRSAMLKNCLALGLVESVANFRKRQKY
ncbi:rod shape-determining protein RodA [Calothrix sp. 336/3]|uniref:rod shape-determining protein RodA n=1 Tax=Calothrix sp. 336/3 TaxID=1337936 RepID=UPI0004E31802|nr:rod shape-determining protein RodA [Calothrix sp. 336/3]AKG22522.1 cell division protein FtsW [Calothrix sp. 336/3]